MFEHGLQQEGSTFLPETKQQFHIVWPSPGRFTVILKPLPWGWWFAAPFMCHFTWASPSRMLMSTILSLTVNETGEPRDAALVLSRATSPGIPQVWTVQSDPVSSVTRHSWLLSSCLLSQWWQGAVIVSSLRRNTFFFFFVWAARWHHEGGCCNCGLRLKLVFDLQPHYIGMIKLLCEYVLAVQPLLSSL